MPNIIIWFSSRLQPLVLTVSLGTPEGNIYSSTQFPSAYKTIHNISGKHHNDSHTILRFNARSSEVITPLGVIVDELGYYFAKCALLLPDTGNPFECFILTLFPLIFLYMWVKTRLTATCLSLRNSIRPSKFVKIWHQDWRAFLMRLSAIFIHLPWRFS